MKVPINTGVALARAAGYIGFDDDPRYGRSEDDLLADNWVLEGIPGEERFGSEMGFMLYDPDDLDYDTDGYGAPSPTVPLRATLTLDDGSQVGMRLPFIYPTGEHGFFVQSPDKAFDIDTFLGHQVSWYFRTRGRQIIDDPCLADSSCAFIPPLPEPRW